MYRRLNNHGTKAWLASVERKMIEFRGVAVIEVSSVMCRGGMYRRLNNHGTKASLADSKQGMLEFGGVTGDCLQCVGERCIVV
jgi:S-ribosylhomocysteine lyase LuxS involved in autoinducer biosynthesis